MKPLTHKDYWTEIRRIAEEFRSLGSNFDGYEDKECWLCHRLQSHEWVTGTCFNICVLLRTSDTDAYIDVYGEVPIVVSGEIDWAALAYCAMREDVLREVYR